MREVSQTGDNSIFFTVNAWKRREQVPIISTSSIPNVLTTAATEVPPMKCSYLDGGGGAVGDH